MDYDLIVVKTLERVYKNYYYIIRGIILVRNIIKEMREKGTCILISSHYKEDIDILCDVVYEVKKGMLKKIR